MESHRAGLEQMRGQLHSRLDRAGRIAQEREAIGAQLDELRQRETTLHDELAAFTRQIDPAEARLRELEIEQNRLEGEERSARNRLSDLELLYNQAMLDMARREEELNHLRARIDEELGLVQLEMADLSGPQPLPLKPIVSELPIVESLPECMEQELQRMKAQNRRLGPVNPEAQTEYEETRQRFEFLTQQSSDLEQAIEQLNQVILELEEGKRGQPRPKPPFPAVSGLYRCPTVVNNVETLSNIPHILIRGPEWYASIGPAKSTGPRLFSVSGHVARPGNYELPMSVTLRELIFEHAGGMLNGRRLKAVIPGGSSAPVLTEQHLDVPMDFDSLAAAGSMGGSGAVIVMDDTTCMVRVGEIVSRFYHHESCGQCTQCREGTAWLHKVLHRIEHGQGRKEDLDLLLDMCDNMKGKTKVGFELLHAAVVELRSG